jgi:hypothetical protein
MGRRDGVGSFSDKVTLRAVRGARQMFWGFFYKFTWEGAGLTVTKVSSEGMYFRQFGMRKRVGTTSNPAIYGVSRFPLLVMSS